jgi:hypothetical protein
MISDQYCLDPLIINFTTSKKKGEHAVTHVFSGHRLHFFFYSMIHQLAWPDGFTNVVADMACEIFTN